MKKSKAQKREEAQIRQAAHDALSLREKIEKERARRAGRREGREALRLARGDK